MTTHAKGLAWRAANNDIRVGKFRIRRQKRFSAMAVKVRVICGATIGIHLESKRLESRSLKSQSQPTATRKQIENNLGPADAWK